MRERDGRWEAVDGSWGRRLTPDSNSLRRWSYGGRQPPLEQKDR